MMSRRWLWGVAGALGLIAAFIAGRGTGDLQRGLKMEANYPWDLHRRIAAASIDCAKLRESPFGPWYVEQLAPDDVLIVARYDAPQQMVTAVALDPLQREATDSWPLECGLAPATKAP